MLFKTNAQGTPIERTNRFQLEKDFPNVGFPPDLASANLTFVNTIYATEAPFPTITSTQRAVQNELPTLVDGKWVVGWTIETVPNARLEEDVQEIADQITQDDEKLVALALTTIDLVLALRDGQLAGRTKQQITTIFRERVVEALRGRRGL